MSRSRRKSSNRIAVAFVLLVLAAAGTAALALYVKLTPADRVTRPDVSSEDKGLPAPSAVTVQIPVIQYEGSALGFGKRTYSASPNADPKVSAINEFLHSSGLAEPDVRAISVDIEDGIAHVHFTEGFDKGEGSMDEAALIYGLRAVMGQFEDVGSFRIFVAGNQIEALGHFEFGDLIEPIPVSRWKAPISAAAPETTEQTPPPSMPR